jgi:hypothetical protein
VLAHFANDGGIFRANSSFVNWRAVFSSQTSCLDNVFCAEGNFRQLAVPGCFLRHHLDPGVNRGIHRVNAIEAWLQRKFALLTGGI